MAAKENKSLSIKSSRSFWIIIWSLCILFILFEIPIVRHGHFGDHSIDHYFGFFGILGFISILFLIVLAKVLGLILSVKEDYYDGDIN